MATVKVHGPASVATIIEDDEEDIYGWQCECGREQDLLRVYYHDIVAMAEVHVDLQCSKLKG